MAAFEGWSLCANWLFRVGALPPDERVIGPSATIFNLAQTLRDGVMLCYLLNELSPGCIDAKDFSPKPQMTQFLCKKNIMTFLKTLKSHFGLRDADLFDSYDLLDVKDFEKVIITLSKLSITEKAQRHTHGFTLRQHDDDIYKNLEELALDQQPDDDIYAQLPAEEDEDIYEDLCSMGKSRSKSQPSQRKTKWHFCLEELVVTEKKYVEALKMITSLFMRPLENVIDDAAKRLIFGNMEELLRAHQGLCMELLKFEKHGRPPMCDIFQAVKPKLVVYGQYCANLTRAQEEVDTIIKTNEVARERIEECQAKANDGKFKLRDLLALPMQRILKYQLLLRELAKHTEKDGKGDRKEVDKAVETMQDLSLFVNEVKRDTEALDLIKEIKTNIYDLAMPENTELQHYGRLIKDGELKVKSHDEVKTQERLRYIFLFDKVMLMCKSKGEMYTYKNALVLHQYDVDCGALNGKRQSEKWRHQFMLVEKNNKTVHTFYAKTEEYRQKWIHAIQLAQENFQPPHSKDNGHEFIMHTFERPAECDHCQKLLRGVFYQGYICSRTRKKAHKECIGPLTRGSASVPGMRAKKVKAQQAYRGEPRPPSSRPPLFFEGGDVIDLLITEDKWYKGRFGDAEGWFPAYTVYDHRPAHNPSSYEPSKPPQFPKVSRMASQSSIDASAVNSASGGGNSSSYVNLSAIEDYPWFAGKITREAATISLQTKRNGTFLVRERDQSVKEYALSVKFGAVKHIKIMKNVDSFAHGKQYYLADVRFFHSIPELIDFYQKNSLEESFPELKSHLKTPYHADQAGAPVASSLGPVVGYATASFDYSSYQTNQISLTKGDRVAILSKAGGQRGWWKGAVVNTNQPHGPIGYFPLNYVEEEM